MRFASVLVVLGLLLLEPALGLIQYSLPASTQLMTDFNALSFATVDTYEVSLGAGIHTGCTTGATINLNSGNAISISVIGDSMATTTIDCEDISRTVTLFRCLSGCIGHVEGVTITRTSSTVNNVGTIADVTSSSFSMTDVTIKLTFNSGGNPTGVTSSATTGIVGRTSSTLTFLRVHHVDNINSKGAIYVTGDSTLYMTDSDASGNYAKLGAVVVAHQSTVELTGCSISNSESLLRGCGVYASTSTVSIVDSTFSDNVALGGSGGDLYLTPTMIVSLVNSSFTRSSASDSGGSLFLTSNSQATLSGTTFDNCISPLAGALFFRTSSTVLITNSTFMKNNATVNYGGALVLRDGCSIEVNRVVFANNVALMHSGVAAIFGSPASNATFTESLFVSNSAEDGGCVSGLQIANIEFHSCSFLNNSAKGDGGVYQAQQSSTVLLDDCLFKSNSATNGAAVYIKNFGPALMSNCIFELNSAKLYSAVYFNGCPDCQIHDSLFKFNRADYGAALYAAASTTVMDRVTVVSNTAVIDSSIMFGGGSSGHYQVSNSDCSYNAAVQGACLRVQSGAPTFLINTTITGNTARSRGGVLRSYASAGSTTFINVTASENSSPSGGFAYVHGVVILRDSFLNENSATYGGAFYGVYTSCVVTLSNVVLQSNRGTGGGGSVYLVDHSNFIASNGTFFILSSSEGKGGAMYVAGESVALLSSCHFLGNSGSEAADMFLMGSTAEMNGTSFGSTETNQGGSVALDCSSTSPVNANVTFRNCIFDNVYNPADFAAIESRGGTVVVENTEFVGCLGSSIIYLEQDSQFPVRASINGAFTGCVAYGAVIYVENAEVTIQDSLFEGNSAVTGVITWFTAVSAQVIDSTFFNNSMDGYGPVYFFDVESAFVRGTIFEEQFAPIGLASGVRFSNVQRGEVTSCTFLGNFGLGGSVSFADCREFLVSNVVIESSFGLLAGTIGIRDFSNGTVQNCAMTSNTAGSVGVFRIESSVVTVTNASFLNCFSPPEVPVVYIGSGELTLGSGVEFSESSRVMLAASYSVVTAGPDIVFVSAGAPVVFSLDSVLIFRGCILVSLWDAPVLAVLGVIALEDSVVYSETYAALLTSLTLYSVVDSVVVGFKPLSNLVDGSTIDGSFVGCRLDSTAAVTCSSELTVNSSLVCGFGGHSTSLPSTGYRCDLHGDYGETEAATAGLSCLQACAATGICVDTHGVYVDTLGCPLCHGACWQHLDNCNSSIGYCIDEPDGSFACVCKTGLTGDGITSCNDVDECAGASLELCPWPGTQCVNSYGSFDCACISGLVVVDGTCVNEDECASGSHNCASSGGVCTDTIGSFLCSCDVGYYGSGVECTQCPYANSTTAGGESALTVDACECKDDFYLDVESASCRSCPLNSYSFAGAVGLGECFCNALYVRSPDGSECIECGPGYYLSDGGCFPCLPDTFTNSSGASACTPCPTNMTTSYTMGASTCECLPFFHAIGGGVDGPLECVMECPPGRFVYNSQACLQCSVGFYSEAINSASCLTCPTGSTSSAGSPSVSLCICESGRMQVGQECWLLCPPGTVYNGRVDACLTCGPDTYSGGGTATECTRCPILMTTAGRSGAGSVEECECVIGFGLRPDVFGELVCLVECPLGSAIVDGDSCEVCGPGFYSSELHSDACTPCPPFATSPSNATSPALCFCPGGFYAVGGGDGTVMTACELCPKGAVCAGGTAEPIAAPGYEAGRGEGAVFVACVPADACSGNGTCSPGYEGDLCAGCAAEYFRLNGRCLPCRGSSTKVLGLIGLLLLTACGVFLVALHLLNEEGRQGGEWQLRMGGLAIAFNSLQIVAMFGEVNVEWPPTVQALFDTLSLVNFNIELAGPECFRRGGSEEAVSVTGSSADEPPPSSTHPFVLRWMVLLMAPVALAVCLALGASLITAIRYAVSRARGSGARGVDQNRSSGGGGGGGGGGSSRENGHEEESRNVAVYRVALPVFRAARSAFMSIALILYLPITTATLQPFRCVDNGDGLQVLAASRDLVCGSDRHSTIVLGAVLPIVVYVIGIPVVLMGLLLWWKPRMSEADFDSVFYVVVGKYSRERYWYEGVVLGRRLAIALTMTVVSGSPFIGAAAAVVVLLLSFVATRHVAPYAVSWYTHIESVSLLVTVCILEAGIALKDSSSPALRNVFVMGLLLVNLGCLAAAVGFDVWILRQEWIKSRAPRATITESVDSLPFSTNPAFADLIETQQEVHHQQFVTTVPPPPPLSGEVLALSTRESSSDFDGLKTWSNLATVVPPPPPPPPSLPPASCDSIPEVPLPPPLPPCFD